MQLRVHGDVKEGSVLTILIKALFLNVVYPVFRSVHSAEILVDAEKGCMHFVEL